MKYIWMTLTTVFLAIGCGASSGESIAFCTLGSTDACTCENGLNGAQQCNENGTAWDPCVCTVDDVGPATDADTGPMTDTPPSTTKLIQDYSVSPNPNNALSALVTITTSQPTRADARFYAPGVEMKKTGKTTTSTEHAITVVGMRAETEYEILISAETPDMVTGSSVTAVFTTGPLPAAMPEFTVTVHDASKVQAGTTIFGVGRMGEDIDPITPLYVGVDESGEVVWYYQDTTAQNGHMDREARLLSDGNLLLNMQGEFRVIDLAGNTVGSFKGGPNIGGPVHHDMSMLPNGNAVILGNEIVSAEVPAMGGTINLKADRIIEMTPDGDTVWEWHAAEHLDTTRFPGALSKNKGPKATAYDWTHANALFYHAEDDSMLLSLRHQNWVVNVSRATGDVLWTLGEDGDFALAGTDPQWFYAQHDSRWLQDGTLLIYDNGNERPNTESPTSHAVQYKLNLDTMTAEEIWRYDTGIYTDFLGGANQMPNGNVLVCAGGIRGVKTPGSPPGPAPPEDGYLFEVTGDTPAVKVWELTAGGAMYRATRLPSFWVEASE